MRAGLSPLVWRVSGACAVLMIEAKTCEKEVHDWIPRTSRNKYICFVEK